MIPTRSLIMHPPEVRAALRDELRLVVRPVNPQPTINLMGHEGKVWHRIGQGKYRSGLPTQDLCPLGGPGTVLRCKEPYYIQDTHGQRRTDALRWDSWGTISPDRKQIVYYKDGFYRCAPLWRSPATMPVWASRITLEVVTVGVCRTFDLTGKDALACGFDVTSRDETGAVDLVRTFKDAWNARYAAKGLGWDINPWVWKVAVKGAKP